MNSKLYFLFCLFFNSTFFASYLLPKQIILNSSNSIQTVSPKLLSCLRNCSSNNSNNNTFENITSRIDDKNLEKLFEEILQEQKNQTILFEKILNEQMQQRIILEKNREEERSSAYSYISNKTLLVFISIATFLTQINTAHLKRSRQ